MTNPTTRVGAGHELFDASRGRSEKPADAVLVETSVGRGELLHRARHGDREARALLIRRGHGDDLELGGDAA